MSSATMCQAISVLNQGITMSGTALALATTTRVPPSRKPAATPSALPAASSARLARVAHRQQHRARPQPLGHDAFHRQRQLAQRQGAVEVRRVLAMAARHQRRAMRLQFAGLAQPLHAPAMPVQQCPEQVRLHRDHRQRLILLPRAVMAQLPRRCLALLGRAGGGDAKVRQARPLH
jgi:hypothetical protein